MFLQECHRGSDGRVVLAHPRGQKGLDGGTGVVHVFYGAALEGETAVIGLSPFEPVCGLLHLLGVRTQDGQSHHGPGRGADIGHTGVGGGHREVAGLRVPVGQQALSQVHGRSPGFNGQIRPSRRHEGQNELGVESGRVVGAGSLGGLMLHIHIAEGGDDVAGGRGPRTGIVARGRDGHDHPRRGGEVPCGRVGGETTVVPELRVQVIEGAWLCLPDRERQRLPRCSE